jgi:hypothetical protein
MRKVVALALVAALAGVSGAAFGVDLQGHVVALSGRTDQYGPGFSAFGDNTFGQFGKAVINNAGQVAFGGSNQDYSGFGLPSATSVFLYRPGVGIELVGRGEGSGAGYVAVENPYLSADGSVVFREFRTGGNTGFTYKAVGGSATLVAELNNTASGNPPAGAGTSYGSLTTTGSFAFRGGMLAFGGQLQGPGISSNGTTGNDDVLVRSAGGAQGAFLAQEGASGSAALGTDNGTTTWHTNFNAYAVNSRGDVAFQGGYGLPAQFGEPSMFGIIDGVTGEVTTVAVAGTPVVGAPGQNYTFIQGSGRIGINDAGSVVWMGRTGGAQPGVISKRVGNVTTFLAKTGDVLDGVTITGFNSLRDPVITGNGTVLFEANIGSSGGFGVFKHTDAGGFKLMYAISDATHGPGGGLTFSGITGISANAGGDFAFYGSLLGSGVTGANDEGLWAYRNGGLELIVQEGDLFDVDPTSGVDLRTVYAIVPDTAIVNTGGQDGRRDLMNDNGDVVYSLLFKDGSTYSAGVFVSPGGAVPEAGTVGMLGVGVLGLMRRRRR